MSGTGKDLHGERKGRGSRVLDLGDGGGRRPWGSGVVRPGAAGAWALSSRKLPPWEGVPW